MFPSISSNSVSLLIRLMSMRVGKYSATAIVSRIQSMLETNDSARENEANTEWSESVSVFPHQVF